MRPRIALPVLVLVLVAAAAAVRAAPGELAISRAAGAIAIDGDLGDPGWAGATRVDTWYETNPGDNLPPQVKNVAYLAYDDRFFYAGFEFEDPEPGRIRAPLGDRDDVPGTTDYGGVILDTRHDGRTGVMFLANPRGVPYDAVTDDTTGNEDSSLDLFWDAAGHIGEHGWTLEIRVPFSSLRYGQADPQTWGILLYRNWPREFRTQMFSSQLPRGGNCFVCRSASLTGLAGLPHGSHYVVAPYLTASDTALAAAAGEPLLDQPVDGDAGVDGKWVPSADHALDAALNPDFSQIESDVAQIGDNQRFALFFPERRPFFLEGLELFATPIQAVYTRSITSPRWGVRATGRALASSYTVLAGEDRGGGSVILPGPNGSDLADQDFRSRVALARVRRDLGRSFASVLVTDREVSGGGHNRVYGPDFQWRPNDSVKVTGEILLSDTRTPDRPELAGAWDGRRLTGHAGDLWASRNTRHLDLYGEYKDLADGFRADLGFVPQVGYRETYGEAGWTFRPKGLLSRLRTFLIADRSVDRDGGLLNRQISPGAGMDGRWSSFLRVRWAFDRVRSAARTLPRQQLIYTFNVSPSRSLSSIELGGFLGEEIDFDNDRPGRGGRVTAGATLRPSDHLALRFDGERSWLDVDDAAGRRRRLFTAGVGRLRATYNLSSRAFLRGIGQYVATTRDLSLYLDPGVDRREGSFDGSLLFSYKLNWQSVLFVGYGDSRALDEADRLRRVGRQVFVKLSYALQR